MKEDNEVEDVGDQEDEETGIIRVQLAYALQMQDAGHEREVNYKHDMWVAPL